jgi:hypothetical protein
MRRLLFLLLASVKVLGFQPGESLIGTRRLERPALTRDDDPTSSCGGYRADAISAEVEAARGIRSCETAEQVGETVRRLTAEGLTPNVAAAALRRTVTLLLQEATDESPAAALEESFLECLSSAAAADDDDESLVEGEAFPHLTVYSTADAFVSVSLLSRGRHRRNAGSSPRDRAELSRLARRLWNRLERHHAAEAKVTKSLSPARLIRCWKAATGWEWYGECQTSGLVSDLPSRLCQADVWGRLRPEEVTTVLSLAVPNGEPSESTAKLVQLAARRLRKKRIRQALSLQQLVRAVRSVQRWFARRHIGHEQVDEKLRVMAFTLTKYILDRTAEEEEEEQLGTTELATLAAAAATTLNLTATDPLVVSLLDAAEESLRSRDAASPVDLARILSALAVWKCRDRPDLVLRIGTRFENDVEQCGPRHVHEFLRCAALLHGRNSTVTEPFQAAARLLLLDPSFLEQCSIRELSNFCWFMAVRQWHDEDVLLALAERILEPDSFDACTPKLACRILSSFVSVSAVAKHSSSSSHGECGSESELQRVSQELFGGLGERLLSAQLSPLDASSAIYSYGKASYLQGMGIFDHLVEVLASRASECTVRQLSQSIWACGRMRAWEGEQDEAPPCQEGAARLASHLATRAEELSPKDVAQSLWAMGRLGILNNYLVNPLASRAEDLVSKLKIQEVAMILWALSKLKIQEFRTVFVLTRRFLAEEGCLDAKPKEAASILCSLGRMDIRDEDVFRILSQSMLDQIGNASAQAVANVLWAHRAVHIAPPQSLLDSWASRKLGLVAVQPRIDATTTRRE